MPDRKLQLFSGSASKYLGAEIASHYGIKEGEVELQKFSDGELQPRFGDSIRGHDVFLIQSTFPSADNLMELLLMADAAKRASANSITALIPYFGYARQDRKDKPRLPIGARLVANLLEASGIHRVVTMDLHAGQIQGFFNIPVDNLEATVVFVPYIRSLKLDDLVVVSPDMGGVVRARHYASQLEAGLALVDKHRVRANHVESMQIIGDVKDKNVLIVDDICDTAGTLCKAALEIMNSGARSVRAAITHPILSNNAKERIADSALTEVIVANTIPREESPKLKILSVGQIFASAIRMIHNHESVSSLFLSKSLK
jgi:ribose-phosphate pyrophosphokinase